MCRQVGLSNDDLEDMTVGMCIDFIEEYIDYNKSDKDKKPRNAKQADFDSF